MIYFDNHATTRPEDSVIEAMLPYFKEHYGNPHSPHRHGWMAQKAVETAREQLSNLIKAKRNEVIFTSGATESINLAIRGLFFANKEYKTHIITSNVEHSATMECIKDLEKFGADISVLPADEYGRITPDQVLTALRPNTLLVSLILANNEIGTIIDFEAIAKICREHSVFSHFDAVQAVGKIPLDVNTFPCDMLSLSAHKFYGPKGIGALVVRETNPKVRLTSQLSGGGQENNTRSGTLNVPGIVGLGAASNYASQNITKHTELLKSLQSYFRENTSQVLQSLQYKYRFNGDLEHIIPNNISLSLAIDDIGPLRARLSREFSFSTGSACASQMGSPSHVLMALGFDENMAKSTFRFGLSHTNTKAEIDEFCKALKQSLESGS